VDLSGAVRNALSNFSSTFDLAFRPNTPFSPGVYSEFSQSLLSNLLGGIGYFYGDSKVDISHSKEYEETDELFWQKAAEASAHRQPVLKGPSELFTAVPSRPFFPRGFLWDEGFHLEVILDWDMDLALEVIKSWLALIDADGWIAREQILGPEARTKVPLEFQTQYPHHANPPTLYLVLAAFVERLTGQVTYSGKPSYYLTHAAAAEELLFELYPRLKRHYEWFRRTQAGDLRSYNRPDNHNEGYRWRGRTPQHTLTSGLDDYPRAQPPHPGELHVDALSWVGSMAHAMKRIAAFIGEEKDMTKFEEQREAVQQSIEDLHWSEDNQAYCDTTIENNKHVLICHKGYISLFPFLLGFVGASNPHLGAVLDLMRNEDELWSPYGLRSLSKKSPLYGSGENYWRSPIWVNINYLAIQQLLVSTPLCYVYSFQSASGSNLSVRVLPDLKGLINKKLAESTMSCGTTL
jgi:mannosyl-oligosaccharide glucosidase